jgi:glycosyltransferase involved in cell wall biosynthesis
MNLRVRTTYLPSSSHDHEYFIENFRSMIQYFHLANNENIYNIILKDETKEDLSLLNDHLNKTKKNPEFQRNRLWIHGSNEEHSQWCSEFSFQYKLIDEKLKDKLNTTYIPKIVDPPGWKYHDKYTVMNYYTDENIQILRFEGLEHNWDLLPYIEVSTYIFVQIPCMFIKSSYEFARNTLFTQNPKLDINKIIWECPDLDTILLACEYGFSYIFANNNCWLDYNKNKILNLERKYNMVMNCRPERNFKRPYLARAVPNLAYIKGLLFRKNDIYDYSELQSSFVNEKYMSLEKVVEIYNQSYCGGIFSASEGACYSSSEYLLCGIPVISTIGRGGRDTWYTHDNSIIVNPDEQDVKSAVDRYIELHKSGKIDRDAIRNHHIELQNQMRNNFNKKVQEIFDTYNINMNVEEYFVTKYTHKFKDKLLLNDAIKMVSERK